MLNLLNKGIMIPNYAFKVREDLNKLLDAIFIYPIETMPRLFPLVIMLKKNGKLRICMDYQKLNAQTKNAHFHYLFLIQYWIMLLDMKCIHSWMGTVYITKSKWLK